MPRRNSLAALPLAAIAAVAVLLTAGGGGSQPASPGEPAPTAWRGLVGGPRPQVAVGQRALVVLRAPSLADYVARHGGVAGDASHRRWSAAAFAAQQQFVSKLLTKGVRVRPEHRYTRVLNGFSAALDARAVSLLERMPEVRGVYPVRVAYPAAVSSRRLQGRLVRRGVAYRPRASLAGFDGGGVTVALLDTGVDATTPFLHGHVLPGIDVVGRSPDARPRPKPDDPAQLERHGTLMAGIVVGSGGPAGIAGVAPGATLLPIRVAGWQRDAGGRFAIYARTDQVLAGLERAVDPSGDGDAHDGARIALVPLVEPFAAFADGPLARAVAGALRLDTLVVAPAGNDGPGGPAFGSLSGPGGAPAALAVAAADLRPKAPAVRVVVRAGLRVLLNRVVALASAPAPERPLTAELVAPRRLYDERGLSAVAGRAALLSADEAPRGAAAGAAAAGAVAVLFAGAALPPGALGLDERIDVPVVGVRQRIAAEIRAILRGGGRVQVALGAVRAEPNTAVRRIAPFSSWGLGFGAHPKPELAAAGVGAITSEPGTHAARSRFATVSGTSVAAATAAGAAALLLDARPALSAPLLRSLLIGSARPLPGEPLIAQGTGLLDAGAAAAAEIATQPATLSLGRGAGDGWHRTQLVRVRNLSTRRLVVYVSLPQRARPRVALSVAPRRLEMEPGGTAEIGMSAHVPGFPRGVAAAGVLTLTPVGGVRVRVPWAVVLTPVRESLLGSLHLSSHAFRASEARPAVLALRVGRVLRLRRGQAVEPVLRLDVELWTAKGRRLGLLARVRDLLPGRYAFGLTGRGPRGAVLRPSRYRLQLVAWPTAGGEPTVRSIGFRIVRR